MKVLITTGEYVRHCYFLDRAFSRFGNFIEGIVIQTPDQGRARKQQPRRFNNLLPEAWMRLKFLINSKRLSLAERMNFRTPRGKLSEYSVLSASLHEMRRGVT